MTPTTRRAKHLIRLLLTSAAVTLLAVDAHAARIINVDIDPRDPPDPVHVGDDGAFSTPGGTVWNHMGLDFLNDVNVNNLKDEFGNTTDVDATFDALGSIDSNFRAIELYAGGGIGTFFFKDLVATNTYDLAIYTHDPLLSVTVTDLSGPSTQSTGATFAIELPGDVGEEYLIFPGLTPADLGGGVLGLTIETNGGVRMAGIQLRVIPEPAGALLLLVGCFAALVPRRRRALRAAAR